MLIFRIIETTPLVRHLPASQVKWSYIVYTLAVWVTRVGFHQKLDESKVSFFATVVQWSVATLNIIIIDDIIIIIIIIRLFFLAFVICFWIFRIIVTIPLVRHLPASQVKWSFTIITLEVWDTRVGFHQKLDESKVSLFANVVQRSVAIVITKTILGLLYSRPGVTALLYHMSCSNEVACLTGPKKFGRHIVSYHVTRQQPHPQVTR